MDDATSLLNDTQAGVFSYDVQIPFLKMVLRDIEQQLDLVGFQINLISEYVTTITAGTLFLTYPNNFFLPISLMERKAGTTDNFTPMREKPDVNSLQIQQTSALIYWDWRHNSINFLGATEDREVRLFYTRLLDEIVSEDSIPEFRGCRNMLAYMTASMCARFIGQNKEVADDLGVYGGLAYDTFESIVVKNNQGKRSRRKPFRSRSLFRSTLLGRLP